MSACRLVCTMVMLASISGLSPAQAGGPAGHLADAGSGMPKAVEPRGVSPSAGSVPCSAPGQNRDPFDDGIRPTSASEPGHYQRDNGLRPRDIPETRVKFVTYLPPDKTGMTTGGPGAVTILINRNYPLFVQYSTLIHESVHARDRHLGITPHLTTAQREARALAVELSPANVLATTALAMLSEGPQSRRLATFFQDVRAHYRYYSTLARLSPYRPTTARTQPASTAPRFSYPPGVRVAYGCMEQEQRRSVDEMRR